MESDCGTNIAVMRVLFLFVLDDDCFRAVASRAFKRAAIMIGRVRFDPGEVHEGPAFQTRRTVDCVW